MRLSTVTNTPALPIMALIMAERVKGISSIGYACAGS